jgi:hypothetical protein
MDGEGINDMQFQSIARASLEDVAACYRAGESIKLFRQDNLWSVECSKGLLVDNGTDRFIELDPLLNALKDAGIENLTLQL